MIETQNKNTYKFFIFLSFLFLILLLGGFFAIKYKNRDNSSDLSKVNKTTIFLKRNHNAQYAGMYVAKANNSYKDAGINVNFIEQSSDTDSGVEAVIDGRADFAVVSIPEILDSLENSKPIKAVAAIYQNTPAVYAYLPISKIKSPTDLSDKVLGVPNKTKYPVIFYNLLLNDFKIPNNSISFKLTGLTPLVSLQEHKVDIALLYRGEGSYVAQQKKIELGYFKPEDYGIDLYDDIIITSDSMIQEHPEIVSSFVKATLSGWDTVRKNPSEAITDTLPYTSGIYKDIDLEKEILKQNIPLISSGDGTATGTMTAKKWENIFNQYSKNILTTKTSIKDFYDLNYF